MRGSLASLTAFVLVATTSIVLSYVGLYYFGILKKPLIGFFVLIFAGMTINSTIFLIREGIVSYDEIAIGSLISLGLFMLFAKVTHSITLLASVPHALKKVIFGLR